MLFNPEFLFISKNYMEYISMPFNLKIILAFSVHNTVQFKILNRKCSFSIQLNPIESEKNIRYLKYAFGKEFQSILIHSRLLGSQRLNFQSPPREGVVAITRKPREPKQPPTLACSHRVVALEPTSSTS